MNFQKNKVNSLRTKPLHAKLLPLNFLLEERAKFV